MVVLSYRTREQQIAASKRSTGPALAPEKLARETWLRSLHSGVSQLPLACSAAAVVAIATLIPATRRASSRRVLPMRSPRARRR